MSREGLQRVLVVDDEPDILAVIGITLRARGGFEVELCESAGEALDVARRFEPDLILLDVMMPENDGPTILEALRADPKTAVTPVVFLTAKTMPHETARYLDLGAAAVIATAAVREIRTPHHAPRTAHLHPVRRTTDPAPLATSPQSTTTSSSASCSTTLTRKPGRSATTRSMRSSPRSRRSGSMWRNRIRASRHTNTSGWSRT